MNDPVLADIFILDKDKQKWDFIPRIDLETHLLKGLEARVSHQTDHNLDAAKAPCFIFVDSKLLKNNDPRFALRSTLQEFYGMPANMWTHGHWESNGYFGCKDYEDKRHDTWFRFLVKQPLQAKNPEPESGNLYQWYKTGFFTTWSHSGPKSILCMDCPHELQISVRAAFEAGNNDHFYADPYSLHQVVVRGVVDLFDNAVWTLRDTVRRVEKDAHPDTAARDRDPDSKKEKEKKKSPLQERPKEPQPNYDHLHELARHVIHSSETLEVATHVMEKMMHRHVDHMNRSNAPQEEILCMRQVQDNLRFFHGMIYAIKCRSEAIQARHQNEVALAFNRVAQYHSHVAVVDASAMKVIAALTMVFLPATFVSSIFSMSFFNTDGNYEGWVLAEGFWIYWAWAIPLTVITIAVVLSLLFGVSIVEWLKTWRSPPGPRSKPRATR